MLHLSIEPSLTITSVLLTSQFSSPRGWHSTRAFLTYFPASSSLEQIQGLTVSPRDTTHKPDPWLRDFVHHFCGFQNPSSPGSRPQHPAVPQPPSHPTAPFPLLCMWEYPVAFHSPGSLSSFQREESGNPGVRRSRLPYSCGCPFASIVTRELPQFSLGVPTQARMLY